MSDLNKLSNKTYIAIFLKGEFKFTKNK